MLARTHDYTSTQVSRPVLTKTDQGHPLASGAMSATTSIPIVNVTSVAPSLHRSPSHDTIYGTSPTSRDVKGKGKAPAVGEGSDHTRRQLAHSDSDRPATRPTSPFEVVEQDRVAEIGAYEPPEALRRLPNVNSEIISSVVKSSIDNVKAQVLAEEEQRRQQHEEDERRRAEEAEKAEQEAKANKEQLLASATSQNAQEEAAVEQPIESNDSLAASASTVIDGSDKSGGRSFILKRLFRRRGIETSSQGVAASSTGPLASGSKEGQHLVMLRERLHSLQEHDETIECISCFEDYQPKEVIKTTCHSYCKDCFERLVANAVENEVQWPPKCCLNEIPTKTVLKHVSGELKKKYEKCREEFSIPVDERIYCAQPDCSMFIKKSQMQKQFRKARCSKGHFTCLECRQLAHPDVMDCPNNADMAALQRIARQEGWKRCYRCKMLVEHKEACQHMTCRCGAEFCYVCGQIWRSCSCTMEQLAVIKATAERRARQRLEAQERELREARELEEALQQIAELEKEEERKKELARQERERRYKEFVGRKYLELRDTLEELNSLQKIMLQYQHDRERDLLNVRAQEAKDGLQKKQHAQRQELEIITHSKITEKELKWERSYHARVVFERKLEAEYRKELEEYWAEKEDGAQQIETAMRAYKKKNDKRYHAWKKWRDEEIEKYRFTVEEEQAIREELMDHKMHCLAESFKIQVAEFKLKEKAELLWFDLVIDERTRMIKELEEVEREAGAGDDFDIEAHPGLPLNGDEAGPSHTRWEAIQEPKRKAPAPPTKIEKSGSEITRNWWE